MKNTVLFFAVWIIASNGYAKQFPKDQYKSSKITWFGIDYIVAHMVGQEGFSDPEKIVNVYFNAWNNFVIVEASKYDVPRYLMHENMKIDLDLVKQQNETVDPSSLVSNDETETNLKEIAEVLSAYDFSGKEGLGVMVIVENYIKLNKEGSYIFTIFNNQSKEVLIANRYKAGASGFGFKNYWATTIHATLKAINKDMKKWLK